MLPDSIRSVFRLVSILLLAAAPVNADGGVIEINQVRALAGGVSAGDAPGFPVTLGEPGSYRLTGDLTITASETAIEISADDVTLNLAGFSIQGPASCSGVPVSCSGTGAGRGVDASGAGTVVHGGQVHGAGSEGVRLGAEARVFELQALGNGGTGIELVGPAGSVERCTVSQNGGVGIHTLDTGTSIHRNVVFANGGAGISAAGSAHVMHNVVSSNDGTGLLLSAWAGHGHNTVDDNLGGDIGGGVELAPNVCNGSTSCQGSVSANGTACTGDGECASGICTEGVCCDSSCNSACESCLAANTGASDGTCSPVFTGTECTAPSCGGSTFMPADTCDAGGACLDSGSQSCAPYACDAGGQSCRTFCSQPSDCASGFACNAGSCVAGLANGDGCTSGSQCASGYCPSDDGVCCDTACDSLCVACLNSKTGDPNGECAFVPASTDPDNECSGPAQSECNGIGSCG